MINIGIIGCGRILAAHLRGYRLLREAGVDDFRIVALCDSNPGAARTYIQRPKEGGYAAVSGIPGDPLAVAGEYLSRFQDVAGVAIYSDFERMIVEGGVDAVNDFTPHGLHHRIAKAACAHGKDVLAQKPLAVTIGAGRAMCESFDARDLVLGVFENWRFRERNRHARWLVDTGRLGQLQMLLMGNVGTWWTPDLIVAETSWRHQRAHAGGIALDLGVHQFHFVRHLAGEVDRVTASTAVIEPIRYTRDAAGTVTRKTACDADDAFFASFTANSGATGMLFASWAGHGAPTVIQPGPVVYGTRGRLAGTEVTWDGGAVEEIAALYEKDCNPGRKEREFPLGIKDEFALAQYEWLAAVRERRAPETSGREGLADLACAFAILESAERGEAVSVAAVLDGTLDAAQADIAKHYGLTEEEQP